MNRQVTQQTVGGRSGGSCGGLARLPQADDLIDAFAKHEDHALETGDILRDLGRQLARHHTKQWAAEDACRDRSADDHSVAAAKRTIDAMNATRVDLVGRIDLWTAAHVPHYREAPLHTETLGSVIDRLAVAWVRSRRLGELRRASVDPQLRQRARRALEQLAELGDAYDDLLRDLRSGRRRVPSWRPLKQYGASR